MGRKEVIKKIHRYSKEVCGSDMVIREHLKNVISARIEEIKDVFKGASDEEIDLQISKFSETIVFNKDNEYSTDNLSDDEAYRFMLDLKKEAERVSVNLNRAKTVSGNLLSDGQKRAILKLSLYTFKWSKGATMSYIFTMFPEYRKKMNSYEIQNNLLNKLLSFLTRYDADKIIKRLDMLKERNNQIKHKKGDS